MKGSWLLGPTVALALMVSGCFEDPYDTATVYVRIQTLDADTGDPIPGVIVQSSDAMKPPYTTDDEGRVSFEDEVLTVNDTVLGGAWYSITDPEGRFADSMAVASELQRDPEAPEIVIELQAACAEPPCAPAE